MRGTEYMRGKKNLSCITVICLPMQQQISYLSLHFCGSDTNIKLIYLQMFSIFIVRMKCMLRFVRSSASQFLDIDLKVLYMINVFYLSWHIPIYWCNLRDKAT